jgi:PAS domain S-box-containing protein
VELYASLILTTLFGATFACLAERSRRAALAARDAALASVEEARQARLALVENIDAVVYSVDRDLRLIAGNSWFQRLSRARGEPSLEVGQSVLDGLADDQHDDFRALFARALAGEHFAVERDVHLRAGSIACEIWFNPIRRGTGEIRGVTVLGRDISERRRARAALDRAHRDLARASHLAGKAEVASDVLHNVGNVLAALAGNFGLALERMQGCGVSGLARAVAMLSAPDLPPEKRRDLHAYLALLVTRLQEEQREMVSDLRELEGQLDRVKLVIARQEEFAHPGGSQDVVTAEELLADVLALCGERLDRHGVTVSADGGGLPPLVIDRHKVVEVLACFVANSREALKASSGVRRLDLRAACTDRGWLRIEVADTGVGFGPEVGERLFTYGFTTRADGHGLGLAGALLAARTMGGTAHGKSDGPGRGATFSLEVPFQAAPDHLQRSIA